MERQEPRLDSLVIDMQPREKRGPLTNSLKKTPILASPAQVETVIVAKMMTLELKVVLAQ